MAMRYQDLLESGMPASDYPLKAKFAYYNRLCFDGALPDVPLRFARLKNLGGVCKCQWRSTNQSISRVRQKASATLVPDSISITMDATFLRTEEEIDAILVHEMIHAWLFLQNDFNDNHGLAFLTKRKECSIKSGLTIPVTERVSNPVFADLPVKKVGVILTKDDKGKYAYSLIDPAFYLNNAETLLGGTRPYYQVSLAVYMIETPLWSQKAARMPVGRPKSMSRAKFYYIDDEHLRDLIENGNLIVNLK